MRNEKEESTDQIIEEIYSTFKNDNGNITLDDFKAGVKANERLGNIISPEEF